jgi:hypothetical protein
MAQKVKTTLDFVNEGKIVNLPDGINPQDAATVNQLPSPGLASVNGTTNRIAVTGGDTIDIASTYIGQSSITTLGTITAGIWNGTTIGPTYGGTGLTSYATGDILYASAINTLSKLTAGTNGYVLTMVAGLPSWAAASGGVSLPSQTGNSGKYLTTDGTNASWGAIVVTGWTTTGNAGTTVATNYIGTTDNVALSIRTNAIERVTIYTNDTYEFSKALTGVTGGPVTQPTRVAFGKSYGNSTPGSVNNLKWVMYGNATPASDDYGIGMTAGKMEFQTGSGSFNFYANHSSTSSLDITGSSLSTPYYLFFTGGTAKNLFYAYKGGTSSTNIGMGYNSSNEIGIFSGFSHNILFAINQDGTSMTKANSAMWISGANNDVVIGTGTDDPSAKLNVASTTAGFLPPRMTTTQKNAISSPAEGLIVYDNSLHKLYCYDGTTWQAAW